jgi:D-proline reductase (dithiol) PrdB
MTDPMYRGFAQVEYEHVRRTAYPSFGWTTFPEPSPRRPLETPLGRARVALVGTAGAYLPGQARFDLGDAGDSSYREIPADAADVRLSHVGYDTRRAMHDPDVVFPLALLRRFTAEGVVGSVAPRAFSFVGYIPETRPLLEETGPAVARELLDDAIDLVVLVPA